MKTLLAKWRALDWVTRADMTGYATVAAIFLLVSTIDYFASLL
jgi:hypothetical protein